MKTLYYVKYFFYIAFNWNIRLATFSIYHEIRGEKKYKINTAELDDLQNLTVSGKSKMFAEIYQGAGYYLLERIFKKLAEIGVPPDIIDLGSGKGRVMVVAAHYGFTNITGVEFAQKLCADATLNCSVITQRFPDTAWKVLHADVSDFRFTRDDHVVFFFNPFKEPVMNIVIKNILQSLKDYPRKFFVIYMNPQLKGLFAAAGFKEVHYVKRMQFVDAVIYENNL